MIAVIQRVLTSSVQIHGKEKAASGLGLLVLLGIGQEDTREDIDWLASKITQMRIFSDMDGKMNLSIQEIGGDLTVVSQFTLLASTKKGNRPSFLDSAKPEKAIPLYEEFLNTCSHLMGKAVLSGTFGADMQVSLINDGPVTIVIDSKNRK